MTKLFLFCLGALLSASATATETGSMLTIDRIFHDKEFELSEKVPSKWLEGGDSYTTVETSTSVAGGNPRRLATSAGIAP